MLLFSLLQKSRCSCFQVISHSGSVDKDLFLWYSFSLSPYSEYIKFLHANSHCTVLSTHTDRETYTAHSGWNQTVSPKKPRDKPNQTTKYTRTSERQRENESLSCEQIVWCAYIAHSTSHRLNKLVQSECIICILIYHILGCGNNAHEKLSKTFPDGYVVMAH